MICNQCKKNNPEDSTFCQYCGSKITPIATSIAKDASSDDPIKTIMAMQAQATIAAFEANKKNQPNFEDDEDFGLVPEKPVYTLATDVIEGERAYLDQLRTADGQKIKYDRRGSLSIEGINGMIDGYDIFSLNGERLATIFINMYGARRSTKAPKGFVFATANETKQPPVHKDVVATPTTPKKEKPPKEPKERKPLSKKAKRIILWSTISAVSLAIIAVLVFCWIIPSANYNKAQNLLEEEKYDLAYTAFEKLNGYSDSEDKLLEIRYLQAKQLRDKGDYKAANAIFEALGNYRDSKALIHTHNYRLISRNEATCDVAGSEIYECAECKDTYTDFIPASHNYVVTKIVEASCTSAGSKTFECSSCHNTYNETIALKSHVFNSATCTAPKTCESCGKQEGQALGHTSDLICTRCGESTFETVELSGTGIDAIYNITLPKGRYNFIFTHNGRSNFIVELNGRLIVNEIGKVAFVHQETTNGMTAGYINITNADGDWTLIIEAASN